MILPNLHKLDWLFSSVWHSSLRACVLIVAVLVIQALAGKRWPARFRYALSLLVLLRLFMLAAPASGWSVFNLVRAIRPAPSQVSIHAILAPQIKTGPVFVNPPVAAETRTRRWSWEDLAAGAWCGGGLAFLLAVCHRHRKFSRWVSRWPDQSDRRLIDLVERCKSEAGVRRVARIVSVPKENSAAVFGLFRPYLLLPEGMMDALAPREARLVVLHELLHIRRRDVLVNWAGVLALSLHWFNPLAWLAVRRLHADQELACDAAVLHLIGHAERGAYGRTLLKYAQDFPAARLAAGLVPLISSRHNIKRRIIMITEFKRTGRPARALFAVLLVALGGLTFTRAAEDPPPEAANIGVPPVVAGAPAPAPAAAPPKSASDYGPEYAKQASLLEQLKKMQTSDHEGFIQALSVTVSDPILNSLIEQELGSETKLAAMDAKTRTEADNEQEDLFLTRMNEKIDRRAKGILAGMSIQVEALKAAANAARPRQDLLSQDMTSKWQAKSLEDWGHQRVWAKADYLEYSNILFHLSALPANELADALNTAYAHQLDGALVGLAERLQDAKMNMAKAEHDYGADMPDYKTAKQQLQDAQSAYQNKIKGVMAGIHTRVDEDKAYLNIIQAETDEIKAQLRKDKE